MKPKISSKIMFNQTINCFKYSNKSKNPKKYKTKEENRRKENFKYVNFMVADMNLLTGYVANLFLMQLIVLIVPIAIVWCGLVWYEHSLSREQ